jgi:hypothetical protein
MVISVSDPFFVKSDRLLAGRHCQARVKLGFGITAGCVQLLLGKGNGPGQDGPSQVGANQVGLGQASTVQGSPEQDGPVQPQLGSDEQPWA